MAHRSRMLDVVLDLGRDRSPRRRHPWVLSGAVASVRGEEAPGVEARVLSAEGEVLGFGHYSPTSQIRVRMLQFGKQAPPAELVSERIARAVAQRDRDPRLAGLEGVRLINAEADGLPGLVADRYADTVVVRLSSAGMLVRREQIASALRAFAGAARGFERADASARREGVAGRDGPLFGSAPSAPVSFAERGRRYQAEVRSGQKTGFYLDQRDARDLVAALAPGRRVLDLFAYTGAFSVAAARAGAREVTLVESSAEALALAAQQLAANAPTVPAQLQREDAFRFVRREAQGFDLLLVDPPPLARRRADVTRAARAYKDVLLHALRRAAPEAWLLAFACSHHIAPELFRKIVFGASLDAGRPATVHAELGAPGDHPVALDHPEGRYLSGLLLRV